MKLKILQTKLTMLSAILFALVSATTLWGYFGFPTLVSSYALAETNKVLNEHLLKRAISRRDDLLEQGDRYKFRKQPIPRRIRRQISDKCIEIVKLKTKLEYKRPTCSED